MHSCPLDDGRVGSRLADMWICCAFRWMQSLRRTETAKVAQDFFFTLEARRHRLQAVYHNCPPTRMLCSNHWRILCRHKHAVKSQKIPHFYEHLGHVLLPVEAGVGDVEAPTALFLPPAITPCTACRCTPGAPVFRNVTICLDSIKDF